MSVKKAIITLIILAFAGSAVVYFTVGKKKESVYTTAKAERGSIIQTVSEVGTIKAANEIDLGFLNSGKIEKINFKIGDIVNSGRIISELDYSALLISRKETEASLDVARENLNKLLAGASAEEIAVAKAGEIQAKNSHKASQNELLKIKGAVFESIVQAQKTLSDLELKTNDDITTYEQAIVAAQTNLDNIKSTYQKTIDNYKEDVLTVSEDKLAAANASLDAVDRTINDEDGKDLISVKNISYLGNTKSAYSKAQELMAFANSDLTAVKLNNSNNASDCLISDTLSVLSKVFECLQNCFNALESSITSSSFTQAELDAFKTSISAQQTNIAAAISSAQTIKQNFDGAVLAYNTNVSAAQDSLAQAQVAYDSAVISAKNALATAQVAGEKQIVAAESKVSAAKEALQVARAQLNKVIAPADRHDIALYQAKIRQAQSALDSANKQIENSFIKAPISGQLTKINYEVGEQIMSGASAVSMLGENSFEIEVLISEADIAKVKKGQNCVITLDAFGDDIKFSGAVHFIEPAETEVQDVIYYKVTIMFNPAGRNVKSGMTANIVITTAEKNNVLIIPNRVIIDKGDQGKFARILAGNQIQEKKITTGLRGDGGLTEVLSGLKEGEEVIIYIKEEK